MFTLTTQAHIVGLSSHAVFDFFVHSTDEDFQAWWPDVHLNCRMIRRSPNHVGNIIEFDQLIGPYRVREKGIIVEAIPGRRFARQVIQGVRLPIFIAFDLVEDERGVTITHTINAGYRGIGRILDPLFRLFFTRKFIAALDEHLLMEFELLRNVTTVAARRG